ncbi:MAG: hydrolase Nlp/P60 [Syntrophaceae bacterium]|nr:hydrolase Nlp/P60 [Syntrophaceae bacterium]
MSPMNLWMVWIVLLTSVSAPTDPIQDIRRLKQDHGVYLEAVSADAALLLAEEQHLQDRQYNARFFSPWHRTSPRYAREDVEEEFHEGFGKTGFGENRRPHDPAWIRRVCANAQLEAYPNSGRRAITLVNANMRTVPTQKPHFRSCGPDACDYPFDRFQQTLVAANTPLWVSHMSADGAWLLAETGFTYGWIPAREAAWVDDAFVQRWESGRYAAVLQDETPFYSVNGRFLFNTSLGMMFPEEGPVGGPHLVLAAVADEEGRAVIRQVVLPEEAAAAKPLPLTRRNLARVANVLVGQPYGWGGMYENRDCSAMIRDLFAPFGIWLPRNSKDQAREGGRWVDLSMLKPVEKERVIRRDGIPYLTLLYTKGHIMLYMGVHEDDVLVFHNFWSVRTKGKAGLQRKRIVGRAAVTTLRPGGNRYGKGKYGYLRGLLGMTFLTDPASIPKAQEER